jgi:hypothetical protein
VRAWSTWGVRSIRFRVAAVLAAATIVATLVAGASPAADSGTPATPRLNWRACVDGPPGAQCSIATVPLD